MLSPLTTVSSLYLLKMADLRPHWNAPKKAKDNNNDLNDAVKEVNLKLQIILNSKEKLNKILQKNNVHSTVNSIYGPLGIIIICLTII